MAFDVLSRSTRVARLQLVTLSISTIAVNFWDVSIASLPFGLTTDKENLDTLLPAILIAALILSLVHYSLYAFDDFNTQSDRKYFWQPIKEDAINIIGPTLNKHGFTDTVLNQSMGKRYLYLMMNHLSKKDNKDQIEKELKGLATQTLGKIPPAKLVSNLLTHRHSIKLIAEKIRKIESRKSIRRKIHMLRTFIDFWLPIVLFGFACLSFFFLD